MSGCAAPTIVLPVAGATISASSSVFGPIGSTASSVCRIARPQSDSIRARKDSAVPKRVSVVKAVSDKMGMMSG